MSESEKTDRLDPVAETLLALVAERGSGQSVTPEEAARTFAEPRRKKSDPRDLWRRYLPAVRQQALHLARQGRLDILHRGKRLDPHKPVKGVVRLTVPGWAPDAPPRAGRADADAADDGAEEDGF